MSLVVTVYVPSGIVMAADSRMTVLRSEEREEDGRQVKVQQQVVVSDNGYKAGARRGPRGAGAVQVGSRLVEKSQVPLFAAMPLQGAVGYPVHLIRRPTDTMRFE